MPRRKQQPKEQPSESPANESPLGLLWTEKYRPTKLEDVALEEGTRAVLNSYLEAGEFPHLLFAGPPGTGKTTVARILYTEIDSVYMVLNASVDRGIDMVRDKVGAFVRAMTGARFNVVFMDEGDAMTADAQTGLRNLIEAYADRARFIFTCNRIHKIIGAIQSRCQLITFAPPPLKERFRILDRVLQEEGIEAEPKIKLSYAEKFPDLRRMLMQAQRSYLAKGFLDAADAGGMGADGAVLYEMVSEKHWSRLVQLTKAGDFDVLHGLQELFWAVPDDHPKAGFMRHVIGKAVHESGFTPDPVILFLGTCSEVMEGI